MPEPLWKIFNLLVVIASQRIITDANLVQPLEESAVDYVYGRQIGGPNTYWSESQIFDKYFPQLANCLSRILL